MQRHHLMALLLVGATLVVFWPVCGHEFVVWDDQLNVYENPYLDPVTPSNILHFWKEPYENLYIPLTYSIWAGVAYFAQRPTAERAEPRLDPGIFHATNLLFHLLSVLVVFAILKMVVGNDWAACGGAMLFALHPMQVEPVSWITGMKDVLCGLLSLVAVWQYLKYVGYTVEGYESRSRNHCVFATIAFVLSLFAKPAAVVVPVVVWLLADFRLKEENFRPKFRNLYLPLVVWVVIDVPFIVVTKFAQETSMGFVAPLWARPLVAGDAVSFYLYKLFVPLRLGIDYGRSPEYVLPHSWLLFTGLAPYGLGGLLWLFRNRVQWLLAATAVFIASLLPALGLMPFGFQQYSTVADRYLYLAMLGPAMALTCLLSHRPRWIDGRVLIGICVLILGVLGIRSSSQMQHWQKNITLFAHALQVNPDSSASHNNYGSALSGQGKIAEAIAHFRKALRIKPNNAKAHNNLGIALAGQHSVQEAIAHFRKALRIKPDFADAHYNLGIALLKHGKIEEAIAHYRQGLRVKPDDLEAHNNLGNALLEHGKIEEAISHYREVLRIQPDNAQARHNLGVAQTAQRNTR